MRFPIPTKPRRDTDYAFGRKLERCVRWQEVRARVPSHPSMGAVRHVAHRCKALQVVAGGCFDLCSSFRVLVPAVPASVSATG